MVLPDLIRKQRCSGFQQGIPKIRLCIRMAKARWSGTVHQDQCLLQNRFVIFAYHQLSLPQGKLPMDLLHGIPRLIIPDIGRSVQVFCSPCHNLAARISRRHFQRLRFKSQRQHRQGILRIFRHDLPAEQSQQISHGTAAYPGLVYTDMCRMQRHAQCLYSSRQILQPDYPWFL